MNQALRIALEFRAWYDFKTGKVEFRDFAFQVVSRLVLNGGDVDYIQIKTDGDVYTSAEDPDDFRWAFGKLLAGNGVARVNQTFRFRFPAENWVRVISPDGSDSRSRCIRRAAVQTRKRDKKLVIVDYSKVSENLRQHEAEWYQPSTRSGYEYRGEELADPWVLMATFMGDRSGAQHEAASVPSRAKGRNWLAD